jgi:hypothetical protein
VHGISTLKVSLTRLEYVACRKRSKILRLANLSVEAILQTKFQGLTTRLKNKPEKLMFYSTKVSKQGMDFESENDYVAQKIQTVQCSSQYNRR